MRKAFNPNDDKQRIALCKIFEREILIRTIVRQVPDLIGELTLSAQDLLDAQPEESKDQAAELVRYTAEIVINTLLDDIARSQVKQGKHGVPHES